jgi:DNA-directed RNA polymerase specialized sigma24 family protein
VPSAEEEAGRLRRVQAVGRELRKLPPDWRAAVLLRHHAGYGYNEVARMLGRPEGTVKAWVHRGVRLVRARLQAEEDGEA